MFKEFRPDRGTLVVLILVIVYAAAYSYISTIRYLEFDFAGWWDLAVFNQSLWTMSTYGAVNGIFFWNTLNFGQFHIHFQPILFALVPVYSLFKSPITLLAFNSLMLRLAAVPLYWLGRDVLKSRLAGVAFALLYLLYAPQMGISWQMHLDAMTPAFLTFAMYYFLNGREFRYFGFLLLALATKEVIVLVAFGIALYGLWKARGTLYRMRIADLLKEPKIRMPLVTIIISVVWALLSISVIQYYNGLTPFSGVNEQTVSIVWWDHFGPNLQSIMTKALMDPLFTMSVLAGNIGGGAYWGPPPYLGLPLLVAPLLMIGFLKPSVLLMPSPYVVWFLMSRNPFLWSFRAHYAAPLIPFIFAATILGVESLMRMDFGIAKSLFWRFKNKARLPKLAGIIALVLLTNQVFVLLYFPNESWFRVEQPNLYTEADGAHKNSIRQVLSVIPRDTPVVAQPSLLPYVSDRLHAYPGWRPGIDAAFIVIDTAQPSSLLGSPGEYWQFIPVGQALMELRRNASYNIVVSTDGVILYSRVLEERVQLSSLTGGRGLVAAFQSGSGETGGEQFATKLLNLGPTPTFWSTNWYLYPPEAGVGYPFLAEVTGFIYVPQSGEYVFRSKSDGNLTMFVGDKMIFPTANVSSIGLEQGFHKIDLSYGSKQDGGTIWVEWLKPGKKAWETINGNYLYSSASTDLLGTENGLYRASSIIVYGAVNVAYTAILLALVVRLRKHLLKRSEFDISMS